MLKKNNKSKTLIIYAPFIEVGGIEKNLVLLTNYFTKNIKNIALITWNKEDKKFFNKQVKIICPNFFFSKFKNRYIRNLISLFLLIKCLKNFQNCLIFSFQSNLYATIIAKLFNVKNIIRIASYGWMLNTFKRIIFKLILPLPNEIIVNSFELKSHLKKKLNINSVCIYNPLDIKKINKLKKNKKKLYKKSVKILKILFIGRLVNVKNPIMFLKGLNLVNKKINYQALMIGDGSLKHKVNKYISINNLNKKVKLLKHNLNAMQYLNQCDLLILTSNYEGLPNVLIEAQYLKKYIISTNCNTGPNEILKNGKLGKLIELGDYFSLKREIEYFYNNKNSIKIKNKIKNGFKCIQRFNYEKNCRKYQYIVNKHL